MNRLLIPLLALTFAACDPMPPPTPPSPPLGPIPDTGITLSEGACFGTCPIYDITVYPNEFYQLNSGQFTQAPGNSTGTLPAGSWAAANAALQTADFATLPLDITVASPAACGTSIATDLPTVMISEVTIAGPRTVNWYQGCFDAPDRARLIQLLNELRAALTVDDLVTP